MPTIRFSRPLLPGLFTALFAFFFFACGKKDTQAPPPQPPANIADSVFRITTITNTEINNVAIAHEVKPPAADSFSRVQLQWAQAADFSSFDSIPLAANLKTVLSGQNALNRLKQSATYYARLGLVYRGKQFYSAVKEFRTDTLKLTAYPKTLSRNTQMTATANFKGNSTSNDTSARIYLGNNLCVTVYTNAGHVIFNVPPAVAAGKYILRYERNGTATQTTDSVEVLMGSWVITQNAPMFPIVNGGANQLMSYGSCFSDTKGYLVPGAYYRQPPYGSPDFGRPSSIWEFDGATAKWSEKKPVNPKWFEQPVCQYYNNAIYVLAGRESDIHNNNNGNLKKLVRLDLGTMTWQTLGDLPYQDAYNIVSFKLNNEFYVALGGNTEDLYNDDGRPKPYAKCWKYNPATDTWTQLADFPVSYHYFQPWPTAFTVGGKAYVLLAAIPDDYRAPSVQVRKEFWEYDPAANSWKQINNTFIDQLPDGEKYQVISYNNKAYFLTGQRYRPGAGGYYPELVYPCLEYNPSNGAFRKIALANQMDIMQLIYTKDNKFVFYSDGNSNNVFNLTLE